MHVRVVDPYNQLRVYVRTAEATQHPFRVDVERAVLQTSAGQNAWGREHSGNTQGTLREHSGNTQGTFREQAWAADSLPCKTYKKRWRLESTFEALRCVQQIN
eukprot:8282062-Pyramimonas_sp.AAC.1